MEIQHIERCRQYGAEGQNGDHELMDTWPQRELFKADLKVWCEANGKTQGDFADLVGMSLSGLRGAIYRKTTRLGIDALKRSAKVMGHQVGRWLDPGHDPDIDQAGDSPVARFFGSAILRALADEGISDEERRILAQGFLQNFEILKSLKSGK